MKTLEDIYNKLRLKEITVKEVVAETLQNIKEKNEELNAVLRIYSQDFLDEQIKKAQEMIDTGNGNKLTGVPIIVKDNILVKGQIASAGSKMLENYKAVYSSTVVKNLLAKGAILIGSANMDEFAMGSSGETSYFGKTLNPIDISRVPGGSSAGSAVSVAAGFTPLALGSDTGGSIRLPAAFTNLVGFKPSYGMVSRYGLIAMSSSLDQIGTFSQNVSDAEILFQTLSSVDEKDATTIPEKIRNENNNLDKKYKVGVPRILNEEKFKQSLDKKILKDFEKQKENFKSIGYEVIEVDIPDLDKALAIYYIICPAEVSSNMGRYDGVRYGLSVPGEDTIQNFTNSRTEGLGEEVRRRILLGTYILSAGYYDAYYNQAVQAREVLKKQFEDALSEVDVILTPTSAVLPWKFGEITDPLQMYLVDLLTVSANIVGAPAISIPTTKRSEVDSENLPTSIQLIGKVFSDQKLLNIAKEIEEKIQNS